jgi:hypothetical protein
MSEEQANAKVLIRVVGDDGATETETLWARDLGDDNYRLDNSPFYAYSVSWEDVVYAPYDEEEQFPTFQRVIERSGNRTVRIIFDPPVKRGNDSDRLLQGLVHLGCSYEGATPSYVAVNVPPNIDLMDVRNYLVERQANWEHADPTYAELFPDGD